MIFLRRDHRPPRRKSRPEDIHSLLSATGRLEVELHPPPLPSGPCPGPRLRLCCTQHVVTIHCHVGYLFFRLHRWRSWMLRRTVAEEEAARRRWTLCKSPTFCEVATHGTGPHPVLGFCWQSSRVLKGFSVSVDQVFMGATGNSPAILPRFYATVETWEPISREWQTRSSRYTGASCLASTRNRPGDDNWTGQGERRAALGLQLYYCGFKSGPWARSRCGQYRDNSLIRQPAPFAIIDFSQALLSVFSP